MTVEDAWREEANRRLGVIVGVGAYLHRHLREWNPWVLRRRLREAHEALASPWRSSPLCARAPWEPGGIPVRDVEADMARLNLDFQCRDCGAGYDEHAERWSQPYVEKGLCVERDRCGGCGKRVVEVRLTGGGSVRQDRRLRRWPRENGVVEAVACWDCLEPGRPGMDGGPVQEVVSG